MEQWENVFQKLVAKRLSLGVSQNEIAKALGLNQSAIARLESLKHQSRLSIVFRYAEALGETLDLSNADWKPYSAARVSIGIRKLLNKNTPDQEMAFRLVTELVTEWKRTKETKHLELVKQRPITTKDQRYDAMIAGVVEQLCLNSDLEPPEWVFEKEYFLERFFWQTSIESLKAITMANTPSALSLRGVFVDSASLESI